MSEQTGESAAAGPGGDPTGAGSREPVGGVATPGAGEAGAAGEGGTTTPTAAPDWRDQIAEDVRGSKALESVKDVADLATQFVNAQGLIGNSIRIPSENASDEDRAAFRARLLEKVPGLAEVAADDPAAFAATMRQLGAPQDATGYRLPEVEGADGLDAVEGFNDWAHEANLTQAQFATLAERFTQAQVAQAETRATDHNAQMEVLHREWGYAYEQKVQAAISVAKLTDAPAEVVEAIEKGAIRPDLLRYFATLAARFGENDIGDAQRSGQVEMTPGEAQLQLAEIMDNDDHPYWSAMPGSPAKVAAIELVMKLRHRAMGAEGRGAAASIGQADELE